MDLAMLILNGFLAALFLFAGSTKLLTSRRVLVVREGFGWAADYRAGAIKAIGAAEVLGALGLVLPVITGIAVVLAPLAAAGLLVIMVGAYLVHQRLANRSPFLPGSDSWQLSA